MMYELPPQDINIPMSHFEHFVAFADEVAQPTASVVSEEDVVVTEDAVASEEQDVVAEEPVAVSDPVVPTKFTDEELKKKAEEISAVFNDGFQWKDICVITGKVIDFVIENQTLSAEEIKSNVTKVMNHIIDITDTPYLPDNFSDPIFKAMLPPIVDLLESVTEGNLIMLPTAESEKPTGKRLAEFAEKIKETYADGFTWKDLITTVRSSVEFIGSFPYLTRDEKQKCVVDILNYIIDETDTPKVPDVFSDRIFKAIVPSLVAEIFKRLP